MISEARALPPRVASKLDFPLALVSRRRRGESSGLTVAAVGAVLTRWALRLVGFVVTGSFIGGTSVMNLALVTMLLTGLVTVPCL